MAPHAPGGVMDKLNWWERRWFLALLVLASAVPLLWPETPPLVDVVGHMGRYRVQLDLANSPELQRYFEFHWALVGNLGVDLLVELLGPIFGLELVVKLIVLAIPPLTVIGMIWIAKEVHGRIPPTLMFAIPFVYGYPFNFGFANFTLSLALALVAFGYWLHLTNAGQLRFRNWIFLPIACLLWVAHAFGWGILGLLAASSEIIRLRDEGENWKASVRRAAIAVLPMATPVLFMLWGMGDGTTGKIAGFFDVASKLHALLATLRDRWLIWDSFGLAAALILIGAVKIEDRLSMSRRLAVPAAVLLLAFLLLPNQLFGSFYADMRIAPYIFMFAILAIRYQPDPQSRKQTLAVLAFAFLFLRLLGNTVSFVIADRDMDKWKQAVELVPMGAPVLTLTGEQCGDRWELPRDAHVGSLVIIRRYGFTNNQWQTAGAQLLRVRYSEAGFFDDDRSSFIYSEKCVRRTEEQLEEPMVYDQRPETALHIFPRKAFDFVWMIDPPDFEIGPRPGLIPIWQSERSILYRIDHSKDPPPSFLFEFISPPQFRDRDSK